MAALRLSFFAPRQTTIAISLLAVAVCMLVATPMSVRAQAAPAIAGDYTGVLGPLQVKLHLKVDAAGAITGTLDSPNQGANGIPCADFHLNGQTLTFSVPAVHGSWKGTVSADGKTLAGTWDQGNPTPLVFTRDTFVPAAKPSRVDGSWLGTLATGGASLRVQIHVKSDAAGHEFCTLDSIDQHAMGLECANVKFSAPNFSFDVPVVNGHWKGKLSEDGSSLDGTWTQLRSLALNFKQEQKAIAVAPAPPVTYDPALAPVAVTGLQAVLDQDLGGALTSGQLAPSTGGGVTIGVVEHGIRRVFSYGMAQPDSIFEIGSLTKTFTGLILAQLVEQHSVSLNEPVRKLLPPGTVPKPDGPEITLGDLATQHSGLPRLPANLHPKNPNNPYADYTAADLYAFLAKHGVAQPSNAGFLYSNLGFGLLGHALSVHAGMSYAALLKKEVTAPLNLSDTTIALSPAQMKRFVQGHSANHKPAGGWDLAALEGAGAIRSTAGDMLTYLEADLHPDAAKMTTHTEAAKTLPAALKLQDELRADVGGGMKIGLAWIWQPVLKSFWMNGGTGGYSSYAFFMPECDCAGVVLFNATIGPNGSFADRVGEHIQQRLLGKPAVSLSN